MAGLRHRQSRRAAHHGEQNALGEQLPHQPLPARAQSRPDGDLLAPPGGARQQQVGHVRAGDQQHQDHRPEQHQQRPADVAHHLILQADYVHAEGAVALVLHPDAIGDDIDVRLRLLHRNTRLEPHQDVVVLVAPPLHRVRAQGQREKNVHRRHRPFRRHDLGVQQEAGLQHARHGERIAVQGNALADDVGIGIEKPLPDRVAQNRDRRFAGRVFIRCRQPAQVRPRAEHPQQAGLCAHGVHPHRLIAAGEREVAALREGHLLEGMVLRAEIDVLAGGGPIAENADARRVQPDGRQAVGARIRQRPQEQRVHHAEDGRVGADPDGQRRHDDHGQPEVLAQGAQRVTKFLHCRVDAPRLIWAAGIYQPLCRGRVNYSCRRAAMGSVRAARRAGRYPASAAMANRAAADAASVNGSAAVTPNSSDRA